MRALIITHTTDNECVDKVTQALAERGARAFRLDTDLFPTEIRISVHESNDGAPRITLSRDGDSVEVGELAGAWHRRLNIGGQIPATMDKQLRHASVLESQRTINGLLASLPCFVIDRLSRLRQAEHKQLQLRVARDVGLDVPRTLISNEPSAVRAFADECRGKIITKMMAAFAVYEEGLEKVVFTNPVSAKDLEDLDGLRYCPMTFQEHLEKAVELRTTVVGDRVFTAAVDSKLMDRARNDWRREGRALMASWKPHDLPKDVEQKLLRLMDAFGLNYGAVDFVVTPDGRHVFLEINPAGEFFWLERDPGFPVSQAIADVMLGRAFRREAPLVA
jgi:MvdD family ATP-grasp ribosomal peptide maturase